MVEINYTELYNKIKEMLSEETEIVLATSFKGRVTARTIYFIPKDLDIYFITSKAYTKYKQIEKNPNVALCTQDIQLEGVAEILGHPSLNKSIKEFCNGKNTYFDYYKKYAKYKNSVLIKVNVAFATLYKGSGTYNYLNISKGTAHKKG